MHILAIETSCDETSAAVVENGVNVHSNVIATAQETFSLTGGVIPEEAARKQVECILTVLREAMEQASLSPEKIDAIAVTKGPGLLGSLLVGTTVSRTLASLWKKPLIGVHHTLGHLTSTWLKEEKTRNPKPEPRNQKRTNDSPLFPILTLSASGGHTDLWYRTSHTSGILLGRTCDDAAGEAFDKGAFLLGLPYPGGPSISKASEKGDPEAYAFPLPLKGKNTLDFSFSGLKTALKYTIRDLGDQETTSTSSGQASNQEQGTRNKEPIQHPAFRTSDLAASYQHAICRHLIDRVQRALEQYPDTAEVHTVGGVSANLHLRSLLADLCAPRTFRYPTKISYCTDNAAMIAAAAYFLIEEKGDEAYGKFETAAASPLKEVIN